MDTVSLIALCLLLSGAPASWADVLPEPRDVHFYSINLSNSVRWAAGEGSPNHTVYTVEYATYGVADGSSEHLRWTPVDRCRAVSCCECNVSEETSNLQDEYFARVRAENGRRQTVWSESVGRFSPLSDTILGPPDVLMTVSQNYVNITMTGPFRWRKKNMKKGRSLWKIYPDLLYNVSVWTSRRNHTDVYRVRGVNLTLGPLDFSTQVCAVAQAQAQLIPLSSRASARVCVHTAPDPFRDQLLAAMLGGVLPSALCLCVLAVLAGLVHCYITDHRQKLPHSAHVSQMSGRLQTLQPEMPPTIIVNLIKMGCCEDESAPLCPALPEPELVTPEPLMPEREALCYAQQLASPPAAPQHEDSLSLGSDTEMLPQDYGIVVPAGRLEPPYRTQAQIADPQDHEEEAQIVLESPYRTQAQTTDPQDSQDHEEEAQIFLDWSPDTRELRIPMMGLLELKDEAQAQGEAGSGLLLPNLILRQTSEGSVESEDQFSRMERDWGLVISSSGE